VPRARNLTHEHVPMELQVRKVGLHPWIWLDLSMVMHLPMPIHLNLGPPHKLRGTMLLLSSFNATTSFNATSFNAKDPRQTTYVTQKTNDAIQKTTTKVKDKRQRSTRQTRGVEAWRQSHACRVCALCVSGLGDRRQYIVRCRR